MPESYHNEVPSQDSPQSTPDGGLRHWLSAQVSKWKTTLDLNFSPKFLDKTVNASSIYVETVYGHTPPEHRQYIALYSACMFYAEDVGEHDPNAVMEFTRRFVQGKKQSDEIFECLAGLLRRAYEYWPPFGADSIITGTLDALSANYIECSTKEMQIRPSATRYPTYLRLRAGISAPYTHFLFPNTWMRAPESYLQILPELDHWTLGANLSFYKEELAGEKNNYVHTRASAEQKSIEHVLRDLVGEASDTARRIKLVLAEDSELLSFWDRYMQYYLEFHLKTPRYRLTELGFHA
ncbi:terpenoid synthase [Cubamyces menziesii]|nr:terpenoid synthase [Cubamyces menziesii]